MDLIASLIQNKKGHTDLKLKELLTELVQYERLSKKEAFKHIGNAPLLQKKMPYCWKAFQGDTQMYWLLNEMATIIQMVATQPLEIFDDLMGHYNKREHTNIKIVGNSNRHRFSYVPLSHVPHEFDYDTALYLTNENDADTLNVAIIHTEKNTTTVYSGVVNVTKEPEKLITTIEPFKYETDGKTITIPTYSIQGNNDYPFAFTDHHSVAMPDHATVCYTELEPPYTQTLVSLSNQDIQGLAFHKKDLTRLAECLLRYVPKREKSAVLIDSIRAKGRETNENQ